MTGRYMSVFKKDDNFVLNNAESENESVHLYF